MRPPLGQHFLRDLSVIKTIVAAAELRRTDTALEIGPGKGILTESIMGKVKRLVAVELDDDLAGALQRRFIQKLSFELVHEDFLKTDLDTLFSPAERPIKILGNLPYAITSPIFEKLMSWSGWDVGVFLIQREVAERIASAPGSRAYGILSLAVQLFADAEIILQVKPGAFVPPPKVTSCVLRLRRKPIPLIPSEQTRDFFDLVHGAFSHRRKTIANSLAFFSGIARADIEKWLLERGVPPSARAETITLAQYAQMAVAWSIFRREMKLT
jgi:16S rRNA (adenine1518-N6/adenine1519-N6)-dimethyltransferase